MRVPKNFPGVLLGLLIVLVFIGRSVPRSLSTGYTFGVIGPIIAFVIVVAFVIVLALDRSGANRGHSPNRPRRPRR